MARLKNGETVNGVSPEQVVGNPVKGASISYTGDTVKCPSVVEASKDVTVLIHESTYMSSESELAAEHWHSTALQAAEVAKECGAGFLLLTHVSNRYHDLSSVENEARGLMENTVAVRDLQLFEVRPNGLIPKNRSVPST
jgi:ribonuclease Z